ncbi:histidinol-phosphatase HisJ family protein [Halobacillus sp. BAB-2008]|uniref:histidinol-phosphatase HisJ family protein n=1 Tax=Halobacillus sp. BAB-2008 TaxID=1246484 RepID=UPI0002A51683|nr:histidinol-phosphatase HisJ family protein [Halobacillus sp. BAB-2008]ELK47743.1 hypothetical protein D479_05245 [Halobacillus sp. BAB-2008]
MYAADYHHHTNHSFDSKAEMEDVCASAVDKGFNEICFTEHFSVNPNVPTYGHMDFERYFSEIERCREEFEGRLTIKAGIELCEPHLMKAEYEEVLRDKDLDFILGSVHNIKETKLRKVLQEREREAAYRAYFEEIYALVECADIDVLAHLDLMKRYDGTAGEKYAFRDYEALLRKILRKAVDRGIGIEINTSGLSNQKVGEAFPTMDILKLYKEVGGEILTIGSDSHKPETTGDYWESAVSMAKQAGFKRLYTFTKRDPQPYDI